MRIRWVELIMGQPKMKWRASWTWQHSGADIIMFQDDRGEDRPEFWVIRLMS